jgi:hypothetical protein
MMLARIACIWSCGVNGSTRSARASRPGQHRSQAEMVAPICAHGADEVIEGSLPLTDDTSDMEIGALMDFPISRSHHTPSYALRSAENRD